VGLVAWGLVFALKARGHSYLILAYVKETTMSRLILKVM